MDKPGLPHQVGQHGGALIIAVRTEDVNPKSRGDKALWCPTAMAASLGMGTGGQKQQVPGSSSSHGLQLHLSTTKDKKFKEWFTFHCFLGLRCGAVLRLL